MLTNDDIKALRREFGNGFRDFTDEEWREFTKLLQHRAKRRSKGPDDSDVSRRPLGVVTNALSRR